VLSRSGIRTNQTLPDPASESLAETLVTGPARLTNPAAPVPLQGARLLESRYAVGSRLGEGGMGVVYLARDRNLGRDVALKSILPEKMDDERLARFVTEARITAQLEHPGIVPVHDLFISAQGDVYYSMKRVQGQSLGEVLDELRAGDSETEARNNLLHLLGIYRSACQAVAYAHTRRVVHRDLKPANIMLGDFGEVLLMDWGVARLLDDAPEELISGQHEGASLLATADGAMVGSPAYMAPEQFTRDGTAVSPASDVYALGVILYELLTLHRPYRAETLGRLLYLAAKGDLRRPSEVAPEREIPAEIEAICLRALSLRPENRYDDAGQLTKALEDWLEGVGPRNEADRLVAQGHELLMQFRAKASEAEEAELRVRTLETELKPWDPLPMKRLSWEAEQERDDAVASADACFGDCEAAFESALSHVANYKPAQLGLAKLYWIRFLQAEERRDARWMRRWQELIERLAEDEYARRLKGDGTLTVTTQPERAKVRIASLDEVDGRRTARIDRSLGKSPVKRTPIGMGRWQVTVLADGYATVRTPVVVGRMQNVEMNLRLVRSAALREGFAHVPAGQVSLGGDEAALSSLSESDVFVPDFAMSVFQVTVADYLEFLSDLRRTDPALALLRSPRPRGARGGATEPQFVLPPDGRFSLPFVDRAGTVWQPDQPIVSIAIDDARHYAEWLTDRTQGPPLRLPNELEWEKAARGTDRRIFPWGDRFDASFCVMSESYPEPPDLPRIGAAEADVSPYGLRDLAGGVRDWVEWADAAEERPGRFPLRGGSYGTVEIYSRCASRSVVEASYVGSHVGFRLAHDLAPDPS
jgi:serine/threonine protein kinase/formylglycine-generating enzyme required for sulfatase activity